MSMSPHVTRASAEELGSAATPLLNVWIYFNLIVNTILLPILVATFLLSKRAKRHPTLVNVCMVWILSGIFSLLLFYAGQHSPNSPEPDKALCVAQTSLLYGITPMWSVAILMMVYHLNLAFDGYQVRHARLRLTMILAAPYIILLSFFIATLTISQARPEHVTRNRRLFYCSLQYDPLAYAMGIFTLIVCLGITCLEVKLGVTLYRNWRAIRNARCTDGTELPLLLRVLLFGVYVFFGMLINTFAMFDGQSALPDIFAATIGTVVFLIFGTQGDVLRVWCFWLKDRPAKPTPIYICGEPNCRLSIDLAKSATPRDIEWSKSPVGNFSAVHLTPPPPVALP